jgi:hypothetical protein
VGLFAKGFSQDAPVGHWQPHLARTARA